MSKIRTFLQSSRGVSTVETALLVSLLSLASLGALGRVGAESNNSFEVAGVQICKAINDEVENKGPLGKNGGPAGGSAGTCEQ